MLGRPRRVESRRVTARGQAWTQEHQERSKRGRWPPPRWRWKEAVRLGICFGGANIMADQVAVGCEKRKEARMTPKFLA